MNMYGLFIACIQFPVAVRRGHWILCSQTRRWFWVCLYEGWEPNLSPSKAIYAHRHWVSPQPHYEIFDLHKYVSDLVVFTFGTRSFCVVISIYIYVGTYVRAYIWKSKDNFHRSVLSSSHFSQLPPWLSLIFINIRINKFSEAVSPHILTRFKFK